MVGVQQRAISAERGEEKGKSIEIYVPRVVALPLQLRQLPPTASKMLEYTYLIIHDAWTHVLSICYM